MSHRGVRDRGPLDRGDEEYVVDREAAGQKKNRAQASGRRDDLPATATMRR